MVLDKLQQAILRQCVTSPNEEIDYQDNDVAIVAAVGTQKMAPSKLIIDSKQSMKLFNSWKMEFENRMKKNNE